MGRVKGDRPFTLPYTKSGDFRRQLNSPANYPAQRTRVLLELSRVLDSCHFPIAALNRENGRRK